LNSLLHFNTPPHPAPRSGLVASGCNKVITFHGPVQAVPWSRPEPICCEMGGLFPTQCGLYFP
jgi:hypothetical protein